MQELEQYDYFEQRAEEERAAAANAADERAAQSHRHLARRYERKAHAGAHAQEDDGEADSIGALAEGLKIIP